MSQRVPVPAPEPQRGGALPSEVTTFVGRRIERQLVRDQLSESRLVTLTGFGGVGKTRLALRVATDLRRAFRDGVAFVSLATQSDPSMIASAIGGALGMEGRSVAAPTSALVEYLRDRSVLLVLDNCEHVIDDVAVLTDTLLRTCPQVRVLATSREPLRIQGETIHAVRPLPVPPADTTEPLQSYESVSLFLERARPLLGEVEFSEANRRAIGLIVSRLEGIPLAIELAAGRLRGMSLVELEQALTERWDLLSRGSRSAPARQQTMAACIEWSFDLCSATEQLLWARLAVFSDGFELDAAREVTGMLGGERIDDVLFDLVDKSIVVAETWHASTRYRMLPPIRHRGTAHLTAIGEGDEYRLRHARWCCDLAHRVSAEWMSPVQTEGMDRLRRELSNISTALDYLSTGPVEEVRRGLRMGADLLEFGLADGFFREGLTWFDRLLAQDPVPTPERADALRTTAWFAAMQGDLDRAKRYLEEGRRVAEQFGGAVHVRMTQATAFVAMFSGEYASAGLHFEAALTGFAELGDTAQCAHTWALLSLTRVLIGDVPAALDAYAQCRDLTQPVGEHWYLSYATWIAGLAQWIADRPEEAVALQRESLRLKRLTHDRTGIGVSLEALAWITADREPERAARMLGAAQRIWDRTGSSTASLPGLSLLHEACVGGLTQRLGQDAFAAAHSGGGLLDAQEAIDFALQEQAAPARTRTSPRRAGKPNTLTRREQQIAELVAADMSNQEIASKLVISKRTAETHVENILSKLGFTSRTQITAWMLEQAATANAV